MQMTPEPSINSPDSEQEYLLVDASNEFLATYAVKGNQSKNPMGELASKYQTFQITKSIKKFMTDYQYKSEEPKEGKVYWWRSTLSCPLTNKQFGSSIARICVDERGHVNENIHENIRDFFGVEGEGYIIRDGFVFFNTKKMAHQTAALATLEYILIHDGVIPTSTSTLKATFDFDSEALQEIQQGRGQETDTNISDNDIEEDRNPLHDHLPTDPIDTHGAKMNKAKTLCEHVPEFIHGIYNLGVRPSGLQIEFRVGNSSTITKEEYLKMSGRRFLSTPTYLVCTLYIQIPIRQEILGHPSISKREAFRSAVNQLEEFLGVSTAVVAASVDTIIDMDVEMETVMDTDTNSGIIMNHEAAKEKMEIYIKYQQSQPKCVAYPPSFSIKDIYPTTCDIDDGEEDHCLYLYQISMDRECLSLLAGGEGINRGEDPSCLSSQEYGILFAEDISCGFRSPVDISFPIDRMSSKAGNVSLTKRTIVRFDPSVSSGSCDLLDMLIRLNMILEDGNNYGKSKACRDHAKTGGKGPDLNAFNHLDTFITHAKLDMKTSLSKRTYMLVPIQQLSSPERLDSLSRQEVQIDWGLVERIVQNQLVPYMEWVGTRRDNRHSRGFVFQRTSPYLYSLDHRCHQHDGILTPQSPMMENSEYDTYQDYYSSKHNIQIEHTDLPLLPVKHLISMNRELSTCTDQEITEKEQNITHLVPELTMVFPLPWDMLMMKKIFLSMVKPMERVIQLRFAVRQLVTKSSTIRADDVDNDHYRDNLASSGDGLSSFTKRKGSCRHMDGKTLSDYMHYLEEATSLANCAAYDRLEHLGDSVLGYYCALNHFTHNHTLEWDNEDLGDRKLASVTNDALSKAALKVGLDDILNANNAIKWKTCYQSNHDQCSISHVSTLCYKQLADVFESLIAVPFIAESENDIKAYFGTKQSEEIIIAILNRAKLPMKGIYVNDDNGDEETGSQWFNSKSACLHEGFNFSHNPEWEKEMKHIHSLLHSAIHVDATLEEGADGLCCLFQKLNPLAMVEFDEMSKMLLKISLFDDSLYDDGDDNDDDSSCGFNHLERLAMFRENLFFLGDSTLHLALTTECFKRNPSASAGDLHLLRTCFVTDDVLAYLMIKHGIQHFLIDKLAQGPINLPDVIHLSDKEGQEIWNAQGGWILGLREFRDRWANRWWSGPVETETDHGEITPIYPGLCGGYLQGKEEREPRWMTCDLAYSFKCIIGALTLSVGVQKMWVLTVPMFEELLLLTPDETRKHCKSSITKNYSSGKKASGTRKAQSQQRLYHHGWSAIPF